MASYQSQIESVLVIVVMHLEVVDFVYSIVLLIDSQK